jgi:hypothetical protein
MSKAKNTYHYGPLTKQKIRKYWITIKNFLHEGKSQKFIAIQLDVSEVALSRILKELIREKMEDPRPKFFKSKSLAYKISRDWNIINEQIKTKTGLKNVAREYSCKPLTLAAELRRVKRKLLLSQI